RDVVRVAVFVIVEAPARRALHDQVVLDFAVAEGDDQILGRDPARLRVGASDARVLGVILDADDPIAVEVVGGVRLPARVLWIGELAGVQVGLVTQVACVAALPVDASLHVGDGDVAHAVAGPRAVDAHARGALGVFRFGRRLRDAVEQRPVLRVPRFGRGEVALGSREAGVVGPADRAGAGPGAGTRRR